MRQKLKTEEITERQQVAAVKQGISDRNIAYQKGSVRGKKVEIEKGKQLRRAALTKQKKAQFCP